MIATITTSADDMEVPNSEIDPEGIIDSIGMLFGPNLMTTNAWTVSISATETTTCAKAGARRTGLNTR